MQIELNKREVIVLLDSLIQGIIFDNTAIDMAKLYNKILKQTDIREYENLLKLDLAISSFVFQYYYRWLLYLMD